MKMMLRLEKQQECIGEPQSGFTLLEVVIAMSILLIGILATLSMAYMSVDNTTSGNIVTQATLLAQSRLEQIKNEPDIKDLKTRFNTVTGETNIVPLTGSGSPMTGGGTYNIAYAFTDPIDTVWAGGNLANCQTGNNDGSGTCLASVTVTWQRGGNRRGGAGQVRLHTLTHGRGI